jgi:DNA primase
MISDEIVERVRASADIVQILSEFIPLKRAGADFRGPCPFHNGTKPNFSVSQKRGSYHCFVCNESGDVFTFVRKRLGLDWPAAVKMIGERVGIEVVDTPTRAHAPDPNERNWEVLATAAEWFRTQLADEASGRDAREYLEGRELDTAARERFGIGFAPRDPHALRRYLHTLGFDDARQLEAGLLALREGETEPRARFRGRVMFPILDEAGHHVGFGGRALGDNQPKYLNSPESAVFSKRRTLYGLVTARHAMRRAQRAIVVEGYMDAIRLVLAGVEEVVAPLGTALTEEQAQLLVRYAGEVFLLYDSDKAGQQATFRSGLELLRHKAAVRVVSLPKDEDPDTFVRTHGKAGLEAQLENAIDLFDRQVQLLERKGWFADLHGRRKAIDRLLPTLRAARDPLTFDLYLTRLADAAHVDKATLAAEVDEPASRRASRDAREPRGDTSRSARGADTHADEQYPGLEHAPQAPPPYTPKQEWKGRRGRNAGPEWKTTIAPPRAGDEPIERALIRCLLDNRALVERVAERYAVDEFRDPRYRGIFAALLASAQDDDLEVIAARVPDVSLAAYRELVNGADADFALGADVELSLAKFEARRIESHILAIRMAMENATREEQDALMRERLELEKGLRQLVPVRSTRSRVRGS